MTLNKKIIISGIIILISIISGVVGGSIEGLSQLSIEGLFYFNFFYGLTYINELRRSRNKKILYTLIELGTFGCLLKIIEWIRYFNCWCIIEIFGFPVESFEYLLFFIFICFYGYYYFKNSNVYEKTIGLVLICAILVYCNWNEIVYQYNEILYVTRYPGNPNSDRHNTYSYYKTKEGVFNSVIYTEKLEGADFDTFIGLSSLYAKDKNHVYFYGKKLEHSDPDTFEILGNGYAKDKNFKFYKGETDYRRNN